jgi:EAL domain-containing protein (putative c-di-GMP-specific phosphodiesterase class I)
MYAIKAKGRNGYHLYDENDRHLIEMHNKIRWEEQIRRSLQQDLFVLHFQPIVKLSSGEVAHHEALLRMLDATTGKLIMPGDFIETAERFGLIRDIDMWVLENSVRILGRINATQQSASIAVNISGRNFGYAELLTKLESWFELYQANPRDLIFEVTETVAVDNLNQAKTFIEALRSLGCRFALDDFGVGFSSLHYLKHLPVDFIKIDGGFVRTIHKDVSDRTLVKAISDIAKGMGIQTIAEFVENEAISNILRDMQIDFGQGYGIGRPEPELRGITLPALGANGEREQASKLGN